MTELGQKITSEVFHEPRGGAVYVFLFALGSVLTVVALVAFAVSAASGPPNVVWLNGIFGFLVLSCIGAAELLPGGRRRLSGALRICVVSFALLSIGLFLARIAG